MKIIIKGLNEEANKKILEWGKNPKNLKDCYLEQINPPILIEEYKTTAINFMIEQTAKRLKIPKGLITNNHIKERTVINKLIKRASKKLDIDKQFIKIEVVD